MHEPTSPENEPAGVPAEHRGMPAKEPQRQEPMVERQLTQRDGSSEASLHLPHERDQSVSMTTGKRSPRIEQAYRDEAKGLEDTSKEPEMLDTYERQK